MKILLLIILAFISLTNLYSLFSFIEYKFPMDYAFINGIGTIWVFLFPTIFIFNLIMLSVLFFLKIKKHKPYNGLLIAGVINLLVAVIPTIYAILWMNSFADGGLFNLGL